MLLHLVVFVVNIFRRLGNLWRRMRRRRVDYVRLRLSGPLPEFTTLVPWWQQRLLGARPAPSLHQLRRQLQRIADDPQTRGVLLVIDGLSGGWASLQSLRDELMRFRETGKRAVAYLLTPDVPGYYAACACNEIIMPPTVFFGIVGLRAEVQFLKDALARFGIEAEVTAVSPYKSGGDTFTRDDISPEAKEQLDRLIDQRFVELLRAIAAGRGKTPDEVRVFIDTAPHSAPATLANGLIDALRYEDELPAHLQVGERTPAILDWPQAARALHLPLARAYRRLIGVVQVEGTIAAGPSRSLPLPIPLLGGRTAGADSVVQALRQAERNRRIAGVVLYVNSPGGGVFPSDQIWREVQRLQRTKPVVVAMGDAAASGGYYVSAPAAAIVAQPGTVTGSIGVFIVRPVLEEALERVGVNTVVLARGANSSFLDTSTTPNEREREALRDMVFTYYEDFKARVREGRRLAEEQLEPVAGGRVWLGQEALGIGLVDALGGVPEAVLKAQELAKIPLDRRAPLVVLRGGREALPPQPFPAQAIAALGELTRPQVMAMIPFVER
jgi:protease-4